MAARTLFLIDGSSQMYRAYHAIRAAYGARPASPPTPSTASSRCCGSCSKIIGRSTSRRRSICRAGRSATKLAADYKANRAPMPDDLAEQIPLVHEACEALGVPIITAEALRSRRRDRDDGHEGCGGRLRGGDRHWRQGLLSARRRRHPRLQPARRRHLVRRDRRAGEVRRGAGPGRGRAGADGRHDRQRQGRAGHRRERRARSDRDTTARSTRCSSTPARCRRRNIARRCWRTPTRRGRAASCCGSTPTCRCEFDIERVPVSRRHRASAATRCSRELGFRTLVMEFAPTADTIAQATTAGDIDDGAARRSRRELARRGTVRAAASLPDGTAPVRAAHRRHGVVDRAARRRGTCPVGHHGFGSDGSLPTRPGALAIAARRCSRTRSMRKIGHDLKIDSSCSRGTASTLAGLDVDTMLASYLLDATRSGQALEPRRSSSSATRR